MEVLVYTDGSCLGNPGPGGSAFIIANKSRTILYEESIGHADTKNGEAEVVAFLLALKYLAQVPQIKKVDFFIDSQYVINSIKNGWAKSWIERRQVTRPNYSHWVNILVFWEYLLNQGVIMNLNWVKGHSTDELNERVDHLAVEQAYKYKYKI